MRPIERRLAVLEAKAPVPQPDDDIDWPAFLATLTCDELRLLSAYGKRCHDLGTEEVPAEYQQHAELIDIVERSERFLAAGARQLRARICQPDAGITASGMRRIDSGESRGP